MTHFSSVPTMDELIESCQNILPGEIAKHGKSEMCKAKQNYDSKKDPGLQYDIPLLVLQLFRPVVFFAKPFPDDLRHVISALLEYLTAEIFDLAGNVLKREGDDEEDRTNKTITITVEHLKTALSEDKELAELVTMVESYCQSEETRETTTDDLLNATSETILESMGKVMMNWPALLELMSKQRGEMLEMKVATEVELEAKRQAVNRDLERERKQLDKDLSEFEANVKKWNEDQETFKKSYKFKNKIIRLNVGGQQMSTKLSTLQDAGGYLSSLFSGRFEPDYDETGAVFLDLDGDHFKEILDLLRYQGVELKQPLPSYLQNACKYLQIGSPMLFLDSTFESEKKMMLGSSAVYFASGDVDFELPKELGEHVTLKLKNDKGRTKQRSHGTFSNRDILDGSVIFHPYSSGDVDQTLIITEEPSEENDFIGCLSNDNMTFCPLIHKAEVCVITLSTITLSVYINKEKKTANCKLSWD